MSFKSSLVKIAINWTPKMMVIWVANFVLKGIAELSDYRLDLDARTAYVQTTLYGEAEPIEVWLDGFAIIKDDESKRFILHQAQSNKPWLTNLFAHIVGKEWKIPVIPQLASHLDLITELLKAENAAQIDNEESTRDSVE
jgi:hypothetical protein